MNWYTIPYPCPTRMYNIINLTYQSIHLNTWGLKFYTKFLVILESNPRIYSKFLSPTQDPYLNTWGPIWAHMIGLENDLWCCIFNINLSICCGLGSYLYLALNFYKISWTSCWMCWTHSTILVAFVYLNLVVGGLILCRCNRWSYFNWV